MWELSARDLIGNLSTNNLALDGAFLNVTSFAAQRLYLYWLSDECVRCPWKRWREMEPSRSEVSEISTRYGFSLRVFKQDVGPLAVGLE